MIFSYEALDNKGKKVVDSLDATSEQAARAKIRGMGLYPVKISKEDFNTSKQSKKSASSFSGMAKKISNKIGERSSAKQIGIFSRQLATLLKAGMPLPTAIVDIIEQIDNAHFKNIVIDIKDKIEEGSTFSNALARHNAIFSDMYVNMVKVGENLGSLDHVVERLAEMEEKTSILKNKVQSALYYPAFMFIFAMLVVTFLLVSVIPAIAEMFVDQNTDLPLPTVIVIGLSDFLSSYWYVIPIVIVLGIYFFRRYKKTPAGHKKIDELKLKAPLFKTLYKKLVVLRFTQNLGILMNNRVDLIKSFEIVQKIVGNIIVEAKIVEAAKKIKEGSPISMALSKTDFLPKMVLGMIAAGEASDKLDQMLLNIGRVYETEIDQTVTSLTSMIEPAIIIFMGLMIGMIVLAVMMPMMQLNLLVQ